MIVSLVMFIELPIASAPQTLPRPPLELRPTTITFGSSDKIVAMARVIGDMGLCYYIKDVVVLPEYQGKGIGRMLIDELLTNFDATRFHSGTPLERLC